MLEDTVTWKTSHMLLLAIINAMNHELLCIKKVTY